MPLEVNEDLLIDKSLDFDDVITKDISVPVENSQVCENFSS
jgi:hypothetical protein